MWLLQARPSATPSLPEWTIFSATMSLGVNPLASCCNGAGVMGLVQGLLPGNYVVHVCRGYGVPGVGGGGIQALTLPC